MKDRIIELYKMKKTHRDIALIVGTSPTTVCRVIQDYRVAKILGNRGIDAKTRAI